MQAPNASPQGIAALYMGNPGALQQKINKDQQAKPGLPPDLQKLMALNIVTNEQDAAKRQQALSALHSMAPAGAPPTVAQSVEEQAKQKLQAQLAQQQQQQPFQGLSPFLPPQGQPQAPAGQGIDASDRVQFSAAEGGIVAFGGGDTVDNRAALNDADADLRAEPIDPEVLLAEQAARAAAAKAAAAKAGLAKAAPKPAGPAASGLEALLGDYLKQKLTADPEAARAADQARFDKEVGRPDTSQYDRLVAEMEKRKSQFDAPAKGWDAFTEYMQQIANAGPQRTWYEAGAKGAAAQTALDKERQTQQYDLTKQAVEVAQKKLDVDRTYNKERYATGADAAKRIEELAKEAAKEVGTDVRNEKTLTNEIKKQLLANEGHVAAARAGVEARTAATDPNTTAAVNAVKNDEVINALQKQLAEVSKMMGSAAASQASAIQAKIAAAKTPSTKLSKPKCLPVQWIDSALFSAADAILNGKK